jgi:opacity protein-like surface antigen
MKRPIAWLAAAGLTLALATPEVQAQRYTMELRTTGAVSTKKLSGAELDTGFGLGATVAYLIQPHLAAYGGWDWLRFHADQSFAGTDRDFEETGYTVGLRFEHPFSYESEVLYRIEAGSTYKHVEVEDDSGDLIADSGHGLGFEVGAGLAMPLSDTWRLSPTVRYRLLRPEFEIAGATSHGDLSYLGLDVGLSYRF